MSGLSIELILALVAIVAAVLVVIKTIQMPDAYRKNHARRTELRKKVIDANVPVTILAPKHEALLSKNKKKDKK